MPAKGIPIEAQPLKRVLDVIKSFETTAFGAEGNRAHPNRTPFATVARAAWDFDLVRPQALREQFGLSAEQIHRLRTGLSAKINDATRDGIIDFIKEAVYRREPSLRPSEVAAVVDDEPINFAALGIPDPNEAVA